MNSTRREFVGHLTATAALSVVAAGASVTIEGCNSDWLQTAADDLPTIVSVVTTVAEVVADALGGGAISPAVAAVIKTAADGANVALNLVIQLVKDYKANPNATTLAKIKTTLMDVQSQIGAILDASHVFNEALRATITFTLGVGITVLTQIMSLIPTATTASLTAQKAQVRTTAIKPWGKVQIAAQCNSYLQANGYGKFAVVAK